MEFEGAEGIMETVTLPLPKPSLSLTPKMFDAHVHLQDSRYDGLLAEVLERAHDEHVTGVCCCGTSPSDWQAVQDVQLHRGNATLIIVPAFGVHPWYVEELQEGWTEQLEEFLDENPVAAIGEIGLDGIRKDVSRDLQKTILKYQIELAVVHNRPVVLHGARAWGDLVELIKPYAADIPSIIAHGFSGSPEIMRSFVEMGAYISFAGSLCNPKAVKVREAAANVPDGQLLIETDSPDLFPKGGSPAALDAKNRPLNQPSNLKYICDEVATLRHVSSDVIADITASNTRTAFLG